MYTIEIKIVPRGRGSTWTTAVSAYYGLEVTLIIVFDKSERKGLFLRLLDTTSEFLPGAL